MFLYGIDKNTDFGTELLHYNYSGKLSELDFLKRIYNLEQLPSYDGRYLNAEGDIWQHTVNNDDYQKDGLLMMRGLNYQMVMTKSF